MTANRPFFVLTINWLAAAVLLVAAYFVCYSIPLSGTAPDPSLARLHVVARTIGVLLLVLSGLSAILLVGASIASMRNPAVSGRYLAWVVFASVSPFLGYVVVALSTWPMHRSALERTAARAQPIIEALETGATPTLTTGLAAYPQFAYRKLSAAESRRTLYWYDLGRRHGRSMTSTWVYPDGDTGHAILALEVDGENHVVSAVADRIAVEPKLAVFSETAWNATPIDRHGMIADLQHQHPLVGAAFDDVRRLLGAPDGQRVLVDTPWELWTHTWPSEHERFFYWPTHAYPSVIDGQSVMTVGSWAYARD